MESVPTLAPGPVFPAQQPGGACEQPSQITSLPCSKASWVPPSLRAQPKAPWTHQILLHLPPTLPCSPSLSPLQVPWLPRRSSNTSLRAFAWSVLYTPHTPCSGKPARTRPLYLESRPLSPSPTGFILLHMLPYDLRPLLIPGPLPREHP